ncbi:Regulator of carotenoid biosynthesis; Transcriptional regulator, PpsR [Rhodovastum atsumiense]|uniref:Transcriptional regulator PpsR n=1 Tax=Rhodovastum atsumiense TaxID=504468 RepID=A0A5M6IX00_9PROT|nr:transcriptional regulator PpsR [Rhodovastum atsumiense]KAA5612860.1 transcriptional regulator PpsR [Rhodovastum atsumiense]CAH2601070.1 Regulator of carotenoid biosynthesis; Transcriptional regulator, PpsR [Rhodovastum atsumiense]
MTSAVASHPDIQLTLDRDGVIRQATFSSAISSEASTPWIGRPWADTVGGIGADTVRRMVADALSSGVSAFSQVTQRFPSGLELPIEYTAVRLGEASGLMVIGKSLQAVAELQSRLIATQHAREQDYWKLREIETRSRLLFDASSEAVILVRASNLRVIEANPAALRELGVAPGWEILHEIAPKDYDAFQALLLRVRQHGRAPAMLVHFGARQEAWLVRVSLMAAEPGHVFLVQLAPAGIAPGTGRADPAPLDDLIDHLPEGFVVVDPEGVILRANRAFLDLAQVAAEGAVLGQPLEHWVNRPGATTAVLLATLQRHGVARLFATTVHGELGGSVDIEITAAGDSDRTSRCFALLLHDVSRRHAPPEDDDRVHSALKQIADQIGKTPLLELVRRTAAAVERHCIEAALRLAEGNRTAAAELLGLSRQSLYAKLNRYGFDIGQSAADRAD